MNSITLLWIGACISAILSRLMIPHILVISKRKKLFDEPNQRKQHVAPIPRLGGVAFMPAMVITLSVIASLAFHLCDGLSVWLLSQLFALFTGMTVLFMMGLTDDLVQVSYRKKFAIQTLCASFLPLSGVSIDSFHGLFGVEMIPVWLGALLTIGLTVFVTNAINLIDGVDGLASGLAIMICGCYAALFAMDNHWFYATVSLCTVGVLIPFFSYNVFGTVERGTKIFMGDTGSLTIGFLISFLTIAYCGDQDSVSANPMLTCFALLMVPCLDVLRVMLHRARKGLPIFLPDRNHIHHKLIDAGCSTKQTLAIVIGLSLGYAALNFGLQRVLNIHLLILLDVLSWTVFNIWLSWLIKCRKANNKVCLS